MKKLSQFAIVILVVVIAGLIVAIYDEKKFSIIKEDFKNKWFVASLVTIISLCTVTLLYGTDRQKNAIRHAIPALIISYFAHLNMIFASFFVVGIFVYFTNLDSDD